MEYWKCGSFFSKFSIGQKKYCCSEESTQSTSSSHAVSLDTVRRVGLEGQSNGDVGVHILAGHVQVTLAAGAGDIHMFVKENQVLKGCKTQLTW